MIYTNSKEKNFNFNVCIMDDNNEVVSQININLDNNKNVLNVNDRYNLSGNEFDMKSAVNLGNFLSIGP